MSVIPSVAGQNRLRTERKLRGEWYSWHCQEQIRPLSVRTSEELMKPLSTAYLRNGSQLFYTTRLCTVAQPALTCITWPHTVEPEGSYWGSHVQVHGYWTHQSLEEVGQHNRDGAGGGVDTEYSTHLALLCLLIFCLGSSGRHKYLWGSDCSLCKDLVQKVSETTWSYSYDLHW